MLVDGVRFPVLPASLVAREKAVNLETVYRAIRAGQLSGYHVPCGTGTLRTWLVHNDAALAAWQGPARGRPARRRRLIRRRPDKEKP